MAASKKQKPKRPSKPPFTVAPPYRIHIIGEAISQWSGPRPLNIDELIEGSRKKNTLKLRYKLLEEKVKLLYQKGSEGLMEAERCIQEFEDWEHTSFCPISGFMRDAATGYPCIGGHYVVGCFRDAAADAYPKEWEIYKQGDQGSGNSSEIHMRKYIQVDPEHILFYDPDLNGEVIRAPHGIDPQQPVGKAKGFGKFEIINPPFQFQFWMTIHPNGQFARGFSNRKLVLLTLRQMVIHRFGGRRAVGNGGWRIIHLSIEDVLPVDENLQIYQRGYDDGKGERVSH